MCDFCDGESEEGKHCSMLWVLSWDFCSTSNSSTYTWLALGIPENICKWGIHYGVKRMTQFRHTDAW
jgi:hypothetical protein